MKDIRIKVLKGPDRVRKRPAVIFLSDDVEGAKQAVTSLLHIFVREAQLGHCKHLSVKQDGANLEISGDDRGIYLGQDTGEDAVWQSLFCQMDPAPAYRPDEFHYSLELLDDRHYALYRQELPPESIYFPGDRGFLELYCLQCVCARLDVEVNRDGVHSLLHFERGYNLGGIRHSATSDPNGSCFRFRLDDEVFTQTVIPEEFFLTTLDSFAQLSPGLTCTYESAGKIHTFCYQHGICQWVQRRSSLEVCHGRLEASGRERYDRAEYKACVELAIGFAPNAGSIQCYHNFRALSGGSHLEALKDLLCSAFAPILPGITWQTLEKHIILHLTTWCPPVCTVWENGARQAIRNQVIADMTCDAICPEFDNYLHQHQDTLKQLLNKPEV